MKILYLILICISFLSCSQDVYDCTMNELYQDYYVQQKVEKELSVIERNLIDEAEKRYIAEGRGEDLNKMTIGMLIEEQEKLTGTESINNITSIELIDKLIVEKDSVRLLKWKVRIRNKSKKDIIRVQGWLYILGPKTKEILRRDTINLLNHKVKTKTNRI